MIKLCLMSHGQFYVCLCAIPPVNSPRPQKRHTPHCPVPMGWVQVVGMDLQIYPQISRRRLGVTLFKTMRSLRSYIHQKLKFLVWKNILTQKAFFYSTYPKKYWDPSKVVLLWHLDFSRALCSSLALTWNWEERIFWSLLYAGPVGKAVQVSSPRYTPTHNSKREQGATEFCQSMPTMIGLGHLKTYSVKGLSDNNHGMVDYILSPIVNEWNKYPDAGAFLQLGENLKKVSSQTKLTRVKLKGLVTHKPRCLIWFRYPTHDFRS